MTSLVNVDADGLIFFRFHYLLFTSKKDGPLCIKKRPLVEAQMERPIPFSLYHLILSSSLSLSSYSHILHLLDFKKKLSKAVEGKK